MDFVEIAGASGRGYRFRPWPGTGHHPPVAGIYVVVDTRTRQPVSLGVSDNLADAGQRAAALPPGLALFTRLNIARVHREAECADLIAAHPDAAGGQAHAA